MPSFAAPSSQRAAAATQGQVQPLTGGSQYISSGITNTSHTSANLAGAGGPTASAVSHHTSSSATNEREVPLSSAVYTINPADLEFSPGGSRREGRQPQRGIFASIFGGGIQNNTVRRSRSGSYGPCGIRCIITYCCDGLFSLHIIFKQLYGSACGFCCKRPCSAAIAVIAILYLCGVMKGSSPITTPNTVGGEDALVPVVPSTTGRIVPGSSKEPKSEKEVPVAKGPAAPPGGWEKRHGWKDHDPKTNGIPTAGPGSGTSFTRSSDGKEIHLVGGLGGGVGKTSEGESSSIEKNLAVKERVKAHLQKPHREYYPPWEDKKDTVKSNTEVTGAKKIVGRQVGEINEPSTFIGLSESDPNRILQTEISNEEQLLRSENAELSYQERELQSQAHSLKDREKELKSEQVGLASEI